MKIAYRRLAGRIPATAAEASDRGSWFEKRQAFIGCLRERGHEVTTDPAATAPTLIIEFGGGNRLFYAKDIAAAVAAARQAERIIYLCDDPDLFPPWQDFSGLKAEFELWVNSPLTDRQPAGCRVRDFPFAALLPLQSIQRADAERLVYSGRPNGRMKLAKELLLPEFVDVFGREKEWEGTGIKLAGPPPPQGERAAFYTRFIGCLCLTDTKHQSLGWRTGRAYHALRAGIPVATAPMNPGLAHFETVATSTDLLAVWMRWKNLESRAAAAERQQQAAAGDRQIAEQTLKDAGL